MVKAGENVAVVESVKAASDIYAPVSGEWSPPTGRRGRAWKSVNQDAYAAWLFRVRPRKAATWSPRMLAGLLDAPPSATL